MYYVYILFSLKFRRTYAGQTKERDERLSEHNAGKVRSTKAYRPWEMIHTDECRTREEALKLESWYKTETGRKSITKILKEQGLI